AVQVVQAIGADREILFLPDMFLAAHVERVTGRTLQVWMGECHVHAGIEPADLNRRLAEFPDAELMIHPECGCSSHAVWMASTGVLPRERTHVLSTAGMLRRARVTDAQRVIVATETGLIHRLHTGRPDVEFIAANEAAICRYMKMITPEKLLESLQHNVHEVTVEPAIADRARLAIERMIAIG
ncbi:MAG TPA: quinolinate synthase NadA, partial [Actinomycetota bacterium]|nr:quinolinate synthase NadA [Actinomycetota bacterium]